MLRMHVETLLLKECADWAMQAYHFIGFKVDESWQDEEITERRRKLVILGEMGDENEIKGRKIRKLRTINKITVTAHMYNI
jgi:hypothetical protein